MDNSVPEKSLPIDLEQCCYPIRVAVQGLDGFPRIVSLWFKYQHGRFYCVTHQSAWILRQLKVNTRVGFEIATNFPPYKGVRGVGHVELKPLQDDLLEQLINQYLENTDSDLAQWLLSRKHNEVVIRISPDHLSSWDYSDRMEGACANTGVANAFG